MPDRDETPAANPFSRAESDSSPEFYFNGFGLVLGTGDLVIHFQKNGKPIAHANASYTVAKTLRDKLTEMIDILEKHSGHGIMSTEDVKGYLEANANEREGSKQ